MHKNFFQTSDFILYSNLVVASILEYFYSTDLHFRFNFILGILILSLSWSIIFSSKIEFKKYKIKAGPNNIVTDIIDTGIYKYSRNPIYLAVILINVGIALLFNSLWIFIDTIFIGICLDYFLIRKEEKFLQSKFGNIFTEYKNKVRKWI